MNAMEGPLEWHVFIEIFLRGRSVGPGRTGTRGRSSITRGFAPFTAGGTGSATFKAYVESRANRREEWFKEPVGRVGVCNLALPVREKAR